MKKSFLFAALLLGVMTMSAQEYTHSVGAVVGNFNGVSYKGFIFGVDGLAFQVDLGVKLSNCGKHITQIEKWDGPEGKGSETHSYPEKDAKDPGSYNYFTFEVNPNIVYNLPIHSGNYGTLAFTAGGGISLGFIKYGNSKWKYYDEDRKEHNFWWAISQTQEGRDGKEAMIKPEFKFGINALVGLEMSLAAAPLVIGFDFRPGYGMAYRKTSDDLKDGSSMTNEIIGNFFDWTLAASIRYRF